MRIKDIIFNICNDRTQSLDEEGNEDDIDKDMDELFGEDTDETE